MEALPCVAIPAPPAPAPPPPLPPSPTAAPPYVAPPPEAVTPASTRSAGGAYSTPAIVALAASLVLTVSGWLDWAFGSITAFDVPLAYLWGGTGSADPKIGLAVVALGILAAITVFARWSSIVLRVVSTVAGLVAGAFIIQYATDLSEIGMSWSDVLGEVGIGVWFALAASVVIGLAARLVRE